MYPKTEFVSELGLRVPVIQGPFGGGLSSVALVAAVAKAGGLGSYGAHLLGPGEIIALGEELRRATSGPFAINLWVSEDDAPGRTIASVEHAAWRDTLAPAFADLGLSFPELAELNAPRTWDFDAQASAVIEARPAVFSFVFGVPARWILEECRRRGILTIGAATTADEAEALAGAGVDAVVATGSEAGGHRPSFLRAAEESLTGTLALVPQVADRVRVPVIAAGGIADARGISAALTLGAQAVQLGTAFLACEESGAGDAHRAKLLGGDSRTDTLLTRSITGRLARFMRNPLTERLALRAPLPYPRQGALTSPLKRAAIRQGRAEWTPLYAGQGAPLLRHRTVAELMATLTA